jgi:hypothetical protein
LRFSLSKQTFKTLGILTKIGAIISDKIKWKKEDENFSSGLVTQRRSWVGLSGVC